MIVRKSEDRSGAHLRYLDKLTGRMHQKHFPDYFWIDSNISAAQANGPI